MQHAPVPRRDARVQPQYAPGPPTVAREGACNHEPCPAVHDVPGRVYPGGGDEALFVRLSLGLAPRLSLHTAAGGEVPGQDLVPLPDGIDLHVDGLVTERLLTRESQRW